MIMMNNGDDDYDENDNSCKPGQFSSYGPRFWMEVDNTYRCLNCRPDEQCSGWVIKGGIQWWDNKMFHKNATCFKLTVLLKTALKM